ncbi:histidinol-phosphate transaminase [Flavobacterium ponti]|uniref:Histidinol-phosphate aminotransferase n=1 Tax=Flavobacterium ponti TaxID=665133 RepID=A0ABV9P3F5_9FLAO
MNNFDINKLTRTNVLKMKPYASARDEFKDFKHEMIYLDANENPFDNGLNRYPDPQQLELKELIAEKRNVKVENILIGNGSDEVLDLLFRAFCEPNKDNVITLPPTYGMYEVLANLNAVENRAVLLNDDFQPDAEAILNKTDKNTKILFLCSPNNPTGNSFSDKIVFDLLSNFNGLILIDEAYIDFSEKDSWLLLLKDYPNLVICQTLSKAYAMAGVRIGLLYASAKIISILNKIKPPYNINVLSQEKAIKKIQQSTLEFQVKKIITERERLAKELKKITFIEKVIPSDANFILIQVDNANLRYEQFIKNGIVVRSRSNQPLCDNCLRITVGTKQENEKVIQLLKTVQYA